MKKMKKALGLVLVVAMVFCLSLGAFASTDTSTQTVTINLQTLDRNVSPLSPASFATVTVNNMSTDATLKDVIDAANLSAGWEEVDILDPTTWQPTGEKGQALKSLTYNGKPYLNEGAYNETFTSYTGTNWMWFPGSTTPSLSTDYPVKYLSQVTVAQLFADAGSYNFTLSFETETMSW